MMKVGTIKLLRLVKDKGTWAELAEATTLTLNRINGLNSNRFPIRQHEVVSLLQHYKKLKGKSKVPKKLQEFVVGDRLDF